MPNPMTLTHALLQSNYGIALRQQLIRAKNGKKVYEFWFAVASQKGKVFIMNGRTGAVKKMFTVDQLRNDWKPFMFEPTEDFRIVVEGATGKLERSRPHRKHAGRIKGVSPWKKEVPAAPPEAEHSETAEPSPEGPPED